MRRRWKVDPGLVLVIVALTAIALVYLWLTLAYASYTLGCDYLAYDGAARAWLAGRTPYNTAVISAGGCGTYQYPPPFLLLIVPLTFLSPTAATWTWVAISAACVPLAVLAMPITPIARLATFGTAAISWPVLFAIKVGTLGPLLLLMFALAWRWQDRPARLAVATVVGAFAKVLPALLGLWMLLTRRYRAAAIAVGIAAVFTVPWLILQPGIWLDYLTVERVITGTVLSVPANMAPASLLYFHGAPVAIAQAGGVVHTLLVLALVFITARRGSADASLVVAAVGSQLLAPVVWDHYAVVFFLAVGWLASRRQWWILVPAALLNATFAAWFPTWLWVGSLDVAMLGVAVVDWRTRSAERLATPAAT